MIRQRDTFTPHPKQERRPQGWASFSKMSTTYVVGVATCLVVLLAVMPMPTASALTCPASNPNPTGCYCTSGCYVNDG